MAHPYDKEKSCYSADYPSPAPHYEAVHRTQNTSFPSRGHAYMNQISLFSETFFQVNNFNFGHEVDEEKLSSFSSHSEKFYTPSSSWYFNRLQTTPLVSSPVKDSFHAGDATQAYEQCKTKAFPTITAVPLLIQSPFNDYRYNQSPAYSLREEKSGGGGPVSKTHPNSKMSRDGLRLQRGDISHRTLSARPIQYRSSPNSPSYATAELKEYNSNSGLNTYYAYQTSAPQTSAFRHPYSSFDYPTTASNGAHMDHGNIVGTPQSNSWLMDTQYMPVGSTLTGWKAALAYGQLEDRNYPMTQGGTLLKNDSRTSQDHDPYMSRDTLQVPVIHQRRVSVPTNSFASMDLNLTESVYDYNDTVYASPTHRSRYPTRQNNHHSQSVSIDYINPRSYPAKCPHPDCVSNPSQRKIFSKYREWRDHFYRTHDKRYPCMSTNCGMMFGTDADAKRHGRAKHNIGMEQASQWFCSKLNCQARQTHFTRADKYKEHDDKWHGPSYCSPPGCSRGFGHGYRDRAALDAHIRKKHM
ncbi:hypothetical protein EYC80_010669 [Monilinia laxa]|uniref:C2H2-type domain-containing protein n=1 Tax=Monilinia laxa TaxID=61186 RepID=A0A5N6JQ33_MONLA|nr:hypothetical protein EYC80_010669 [Monilinia laxa]